MTELFQQLDKLIPTLPGWADVEKTKTLAAMVIALRPEVSLEVGVYGGRSFFGLALAHKYLGRGMAVGIDPWSNAAAIEGYDGVNRESWNAVPMETLYKNFEKKVHELSVRNVTTIHRLRSDDAPVPHEIGIFHCDGQHTEQAVRDVKRFAVNVPVGGLTIMDDTDWRNGDDAPVHRAVLELQAMGFRQLYPLGTGAVFQRVR